MGVYKFSIVLICYLCLIRLNTLTADAINIVYDGPESVNEGEHFSITCLASQFGLIKWRLNDTIAEFGGESRISCPETQRCSGNVTVSSATSSHTGNYRCSYETDDFGHNLTVVADTEFQLTVNFSEQEHKPCLKAGPSAGVCVAGRPYEKFKMDCKSNPAPSDEYTLAWYRATKSGKFDLIENDGRVQPKKGEVFFTGLLQNDTNVYHCRLMKAGDEKKQQFPQQAIKVVELQVLPFMKKMQKDVTAIEENMINLTCIVISNVTTKVTWQIDSPGSNGTYTASYDRVILSDSNGTTNNVLLIKSANQSLDRGNYVCTAFGEFGESINNVTYYVRIKGKYAALIPFLGICGEVVILCFIILIYEKKRDKTELEESDTDQGPETKSSPDHGQDSVRYRK